MFKQNSIFHTNYVKNTKKAYNFQLIEQYDQYVAFNNGLDTKKNITLHGAANIDMTDSTGVLKGGRMAILDQTTTTILTPAQSGSLVLWDAAAGFTITLPPPSIGLNFSFAVATTVTSSNHKLITDAGTTLIYGGVVLTEAADTNAGLGALFNGTTHRAITMNGTTTGGIIGTSFNLVCTSATEWMIEGIVAGSGTLATPATTS